MKKFLYGDKGITIITVTTMVIVILVILAVFTFYARNSVKMESFEGMKADIKEIEAKALIYNVDTKALPITSVDDKVTGFTFGDEEFRNPNDTDVYYKVDANKLGITKAYNTDYYINEETLTVYAGTPIRLNGKNYGRYKEKWDIFRKPSANVLPQWSLDAPPEMYTYDSTNWITGINEQFCNDQANRQKYSYYFIDSINWRNIIIPAYRADGSPVVGIRNGAFARVNVNGGSIKIPATIEIMEQNLFNSASNPNDIYCDGIIVDVNSFKGLGFNNVREIVIGPHCQLPDGNESNGGVFSNAQNLVKITIEGSSIGKYTFSGNCRNVEDIYLLGSPNIIPEGAFMNCGLNKDIRIHTDVDSTANEVVFPSSVTTFAKNSFNGSGIRVLTLPPETTEIGEAAFANINNRLDTVILNSMLRTIGDRAFKNDYNLRNISYNGQRGRFNDSLQSIGTEAFNGCNNLNNTTISIPRNATVGNNAFPQNTRITRF